jgi:DNA-binding CsgD family transcriptional regulator
MRGAWHAPLDTADQLRLLVYSKRRFVRWVACLKVGSEDARFEPQLERHLNRHAGAISAAFVQARAIDRAGLDDENRHVALIDGEGRIRACSDALAPWLRDPRRARKLSDLAPPFASPAAPRVHRTWLDGWRLETTRMEGEEGPRWLLEVHPTEPIALERTASLTNRQREVGELLVVGATNAEVARHLGISVDTVKFHAKRIYQALDVATRGELVAAWEDDPVGDRSR